jgi:transposase
MQGQVSKKTFEGQTIYSGIDYHKKSWKVTILGEEYEHKTFSQDPSPDVLASYLKRHFPGARYKAVYEAGFSGFGACRRLRNLGIECEVIHPADVPTSRKEKQQKTDKVDSRKLARTLRNHESEYIHIPDSELEADRALVRQRFRISKDVARTKNRLKSILMQFGVDIPEKFTVYASRHWSKPFLTWLQDLKVEQTSLKKTIDGYVAIGLLLRKELLVANRRIRALSQEDKYKSNYELMLSIPGVGLLTAMTYLVQFGDIKRFKSLDELCNYVGLVPSMHGSGDRMVTGKLIKRGRKDLKVMLIEASWVAIRKDPALMLKFNELTKKMQKNKAIIRIARKILSRIRYVLTNKVPYEIGIVQ